ncbi:MAG: hypothetical protein LW870_14815 [Pirellula sp.]|jgi:hypothetical protein|nr:hypothetical protein [Pirellula sp.]
MRVYRCKTLLDDEADYSAFARLFAGSIRDGSSDSFLLVRGDDQRLLVVASDSDILLSFARGPNDCMVSYGSSYSDGTRTFFGLSRERVAKDSSFVDAAFAFLAIKAFFETKPMSEHVDFRNGTPDDEIVVFPTSMIARPRVKRTLVEMRVNVTEELRNDMKQVCEYIDEVADDPDENIDFDDAIQIASLCGGRINRKQDLYLFSYYLDNGDVWQFRVQRTILEAIADGRLQTLNVLASIPKNRDEPSDAPKSPVGRDFES